MMIDFTCQSSSNSVDTLNEMLWHIIFLLYHVLFISKLLVFIVYANAHFPMISYQVSADSPAENSGLQIGDDVLHVNGLDVSMATAECVSKLVRHSQPLMTLTVHR